MSPGLISVTRLVPAVVPSVIHSSEPEPMPSPVLLSEAWKKRCREPTRVMYCGAAVPLGLISFTITVPAVVPSLFHSS